MLAALPKSAHPGALAAMREIYNAEDIDKAVAIKAFEVDYGVKYPKAVAKIVDDCRRCCWSSTSIRPSTGSTFARRTRSSPPSPPHA